VTNFALQDCLGIAAACFLFLPLAFFPGYLLANLLNLWQFRTRTFAFQLAASVPLSLSTGPLLTFLLGFVTGWKLVWLSYLIMTVAAVWILLRTHPRMDKTCYRALFVGLAWSIFAALWLMDWQPSSRLYFPIYGFDYATRAAMVHSLAVFGLPAQNPFFNPGHPVALHYHFLWLLQCALVHWLVPGFVTARMAFIAGAIWCGLGLLCIAALAMRLLMQRRSWIVVGLLAVTGLDIIPALLILLANRLHILGTLPPSAEWWNEQVDGWIYTALWEPHYICALIACITGLLIVWQSRSFALAGVAAVCFVTAVGSGSFVALVFAAFLGVWMIANLRESGMLAATGAFSVLLSLPYLAALRSPAQNVASGSLLQLTVRPFSPIPMPAILYLLALPLNYFLELGFFGACVFIGYRRKLAPPEWMLVVMALTSILICTFVKSGATPNNDLGWRGFLVAQFALLILSAAYLERVRPNRFLKLLLLLGLLGTGYDLFLTRFFPILSDSNQVPKLKWLALDQQLGRRTLANREAYSWLQRHSKPTASLGQNSDLDRLDIFQGLYADRNIVAGDRNCTTGFGGSAGECAPIVAELGKLFSAQTGLTHACQTLPADFYIVKDTDPIWNQTRSWVWNEPPVFANEFVRIFSCAASNSIGK
jgi:hypothetical protein